MACSPQEQNKLAKPSEVKFKGCDANSMYLLKCMLDVLVQKQGNVGYTFMIYGLPLILYVAGVLFETREVCVWVWKATCHRTAQAPQLTPTVLSRRGKKSGANIQLCPSLLHIPSLLIRISQSAFFFFSRGLSCTFSFHTEPSLLAALTKQI